MKQQKEMIGWCNMDKEMKKFVICEDEVFAVCSSCFYRRNINALKESVKSNNKQPVISIYASQYLNDLKGGKN